MFFFSFFFFKFFLGKRYPFIFSLIFIGVLFILFKILPNVGLLMKVKPKQLHKASVKFSIPNVTVQGMKWISYSGGAL